MPVVMTEAMAEEEQISDVFAGKPCRPGPLISLEIKFMN